MSSICCQRPIEIYYKSFISLVKRKMGQNKGLRCIGKLSGGNSFENYRYLISLIWYQWNYGKRFRYGNLLHRCWRQVDAVEFMLVTFFWCWWQNFVNGDIFGMLEPDANVRRRKRRKPSPTSQSCRQHISSPSSVTNIDVATKILSFVTLLSRLSKFGFLEAR